jgi:hypothetical protein
MPSALKNKSVAGIHDPHKDHLNVLLTITRIEG